MEGAGGGGMSDGVLTMFDSLSVNLHMEEPR
jgi:hypothetical protein